MAQKVTIMVLKVDLQCPCCYKKVKEIICKFPQIRDRIFNEKANTVTITVVCCDPEKLRDKLCCKGAKVIKSIEIKEPEKPKQPEKPKIVVIEQPKKPEKPKVTFVEPTKEPEKPKEKPPKAPVPCPAPAPIGWCPPVRTCCGPCSEGYGGGPCYFGFGVAPPKAPAPAPVPVPVPCPAPAPIGWCPPVRTCCGPCSEGHGGGPCYFGFGVAPPPPPPPQPRFEGYYGYGCHERPCHVTRCDYYFSEENPQACSIM